MLTPRSAHELRTEANAQMAEFEKLRARADAVLTSGAPARYYDALELFEELSDDADEHYHMAMRLYRSAHAVENFERETRRAAA